MIRVPHLVHSFRCLRLRGWCFAFKNSKRFYTFSIFQNLCTAFKVSYFTWISSGTYCNPLCWSIFRTSTITIICAFSRYQSEIQNQTTEGLINKISVDARNIAFIFRLCCTPFTSAQTEADCPKRVLQIADNRKKDVIFVCSL